MPSTIYDAVQYDPKQHIHDALLLVRINQDIHRDRLNHAMKVLVEPLPLPLFHLSNRIDVRVTAYELHLLVSNEILQFQSKQYQSS